MFSYSDICPSSAALNWLLFNRFMFGIVLAFAVSGWFLIAVGPISPNSLEFRIDWFRTTLYWVESRCMGIGVVAPYDTSCWFFGCLDFLPILGLKVHSSLAFSNSRSSVDLSRLGFRKSIFFEST
jgi:hypothetical protein